MGRAEFGDVKETEAEEEEEEGFASQHLSERIANLDLDDERDLDRLWERLTPAEKAEFESQLRSGEAATWLMEGRGSGEETREDSLGVATPWWKGPLIVEEPSDSG